jgi:RNA polymerase sigma factor (sigma-70 family)
MPYEVNWDDLVEDLGPRLYRYFCVRFSREQADDLTQETLIRLVRKVEEGKYDPERGNLSMLGFGIGHFVALEAKQHHTHEPIEDYESVLVANEDIEYQFITKDLALKVKEKIQGLSNIEQQIFSLLVDEELKLADIALIVGMPEGTVKSHVFRAKQKLLKMIQEESFL